jgi:hypothetical protein
MLSASRTLVRPVSPWIAAALLLGSASAASGQTFPCTQDAVGQLSVQAGVRCQCVLSPGGSITGAPAGYAWDCGVLRGRMNQLVPAGPESYQSPPIDSVIVDPSVVPERPIDPWRVRRP